MGVFWQAYVAGVISAVLPSLILLAWSASRAPEIAATDASGPAAGDRP